MKAMATAREVVSRHFENIIEIDEQVIRGEKHYGDRCYAMAYVDFSDNIEERANHLGEFQERVMGDDFFGATEQLRWNNYLYIIAGPNSIAKEGFAADKVRIEADKEYARKRVVQENELEALLDDSMLLDIKNLATTKDVVSEWSRRLVEGGLDSLLDKPAPRTDVIERIGKKAAKRTTSPVQLKVLSPIDELLSTSHLRNLEVTRFRKAHDGGNYSFGSVTLIVGPNGSGKTSLLEAIEFLYCGFNRRPNDAISQSVKGEFFNLENKKTFQVESTSESGRIKARCFAWYRREERQAKQIVEGFTRFNFLDTDAAFRLSNDREPGDITRDLSKLLIGAEASTLWEYLGKITSDLDSAWSKSNDRLNFERQRLALVDAEHKRLQELPSQGNTLTSNYRAALSAIGWTNISSELVTERERLPLNEAMQHLNVLLVSQTTASATRGTIKELEDAVKKALTNASDLHSQQNSIDINIKKALIQSSELKQQAEMLSRWLEYCATGYGTTLLAKNAAQAAVENARSTLGRFLEGNPLQFEAELANIPLNASIKAACDYANNLRQSLSLLETSAKKFDNLEAARALAAQQLKDAALLMLKYGHSIRECPICETDHDPVILLTKIEALTTNSTTSVELREVNESLENNRSALINCQKRLQALEIVREVAAQIQVSESTPIGDVANQLIAQRIRAQNAISTFSSRQEALTALALRGLNGRDYEALRSQVAPLFQADDDINNTATSTLLRDFISSLRQDIETKLVKDRAESDVLSTKISSIVDELNTAYWPKPLSVKRDFSALLGIQKHVENLSNQIEGLTKYLNVDDDMEFSSLSQSLLGITKALDEALHAIADEASASEKLKSAKRNLDEVSLRIANLAELTANQKSALDALKLLIKDSSLEDATRDALGAIKNQINDVFGRIHAPREYEYSGDGEHLLRTRNLHESRTLEQVSTGQRAAFALSIFLALNLTAQSAPPILLIDDPVAHIDDLNALSFMDYLRNLAVHSKRQIFFATADSRIASLFKKKFAFLGPDEFKIIPLACQDEV